MNMDTGTFNPQELCSRKLWQMVNQPGDTRASDSDLQQAIEELASRRHYLAELREIGKLGGPSPSA